MDRLVERCAGLDVHKAVLAVCVRIPGPGGARQQIVQSFGTTTPDVLALRDWLKAHGVTRVAMESTGVYGKPIYYLLEDDFDCGLLNARHLRNVPGRKSDVADAVWICQLLEHGLVRPSFVPPKPVRELRKLTRYRKAQVEERTREVQRLDKLLQDAGIKLSSVASEVLGVSGRAMLEALVAGTTDPGVLAELARGRLRTKLPQRRDALRGRFTGHHALLVGTMLTKLDFLDELVADVAAEIARVIAPFAWAVDLLDPIPGVDRVTAEMLIAEFGVDLTRFGAAARWASWGGMCPGHHESAGKQGRGTTRKGSKWLRLALVEAAKAASRTKSTYLAAQYARLRARRGKARATIAVGHSILVAAYHILDRRQPYQELGAEYFRTRHSRSHHTRRLGRQLEALGYKVALQEEAA